MYICASCPEHSEDAKVITGRLYWVIKRDIQHQYHQRTWLRIQHGHGVVPRLSVVKVAPEPDGTNTLLHYYECFAFPGNRRIQDLYSNPENTTATAPHCPSVSILPASRTDANILKNLRVVQTILHMSDPNCEMV